MTDKDFSSLQRSRKPLGRLSNESECGPPSVEEGRISSIHSSRPNEEQLQVLQRQLDEKNAAIHSLHKELLVSNGKIRGYETLSHLFQESKQECSRVKQRNDQLSLQLDMMMKQMSPGDDDHDIEKAVEHQQTSEGCTTNRAESFASGLVTIIEGPNKNNLGNPGGECNVLETCSELTESKNQCNDKQANKDNDGDSNYNGSTHDLYQDLSKVHPEGTEDEKSDYDLCAEGDDKSKEQLGERSEIHSPASTNSFVQISNPETEHSQGDDLEEELKSSQQIQALPKLSDCTLMADIHQLTEYISHPLGGEAGDPRAMTADLLRLGVKAMKVEKQSRVKQVMIDTLSAENATLKKQNESLIQALQQKNKQLEESDQQGKQDQKTSSLQDMVFRSSESNEPRSLDWVKVQQSSKTTDHATEEARYKSKEFSASVLSSPDRACQIEVQFLLMKVEELRNSNKHLEDKYRSLSEESKSQISILETDKNRLLRQLEMTLKKDIDDQARFNAELERKSLQLQEEKRRRHEVEENVVTLKTKRNQLELELELIKSRQLEPVEVQYCLRSSDTSSTVQPSLTETELRSQMQMLRQQVTVFKEDFDQERRDREKAKAEADEYRKEIMELKAELAVKKEQLRAANSKLLHAENDNKTMKSHFEKVSNDFKQLVAAQSPVHEPLRRLVVAQPEPQHGRVHVQGRPEHVRTSFRCTSPGAVSSAGQARHKPTVVPSSTEMKGKDWPCRLCTFMNKARHTRCEICHSEKPDLNSVIPITSDPVGGLAGPYHYQCDSMEEELTARGGRDGIVSSRLPSHGGDDDITIDASQRI